VRMKKRDSNSVDQRRANVRFRKAESREEDAEEIFESFQRVYPPVSLEGERPESQ